MISRLLSGLLLAWAIGFAVFAIGLPGPASDRRTDGIVVVTGGPGRIQRGLAVLAAGDARRLLISGVAREVTPAELVAEYDIPRRLSRCCVDLETESVDTRSNADETARWVRRHGYRSLRLVTTDWHMARARYELARVLGRTVEIVPDGVPSEPGFVVLLTEYNKYVLRRIAAPMGI